LRGIRERSSSDAGRLDASARGRGADLDAIRYVVAGVAPLLGDPSSKQHSPSVSFARSYCSAHGPPIPRLHVVSRARRNLDVLGVIYQQ
jgi:hypothetical protein